MSRICLRSSWLAVISSSFATCSNDSLSLLSTLNVINFSILCLYPVILVNTVYIQEIRMSNVLKWSGRGTDARLCESEAR